MFSTICEGDLSPYISRLRATSQQIYQHNHILNITQLTQLFERGKYVLFPVHQSDLVAMISHLQYKTTITQNNLNPRKRHIMTSASFHDRIAQLCLNQYKSLPKTGKPKQNEWTVLSCIVLEDNHHNHFEVVALGTGSKCLGRNQLTNLGNLLNDSHAEVVCRRAFIRYLYENLISCCAPGEPAEEEENNWPTIATFNAQVQRFQLNDNIKFHFFTTHVPCGDAAIFPKNQIQAVDDEIDKQDISLDDEIGDVMSNMTRIIERPIKKKLTTTDDNNDDIYRTGAKCLAGDPNQDLRLSGAAYHICGLVRTKPGRGDRTLSVSCSDKIAKWCHVGVQGALINILIEQPIYLSSFTIIGGTPFCRSALDRAFYQRFGASGDFPDIKKLLFEFPKRELVAIGQSNLTFEFNKTNDHKLICSSSIAWLKTAKKGITKKQINSEACRLRICKVDLFKYFIQVIQKFHIKVDGIDDKLPFLRYRDAKFSAYRYQEAWSVLKSAFKIWTTKDDELLDFFAK